MRTRLWILLGALVLVWFGPLDFVGTAYAKPLTSVSDGTKSRSGHKSRSKRRKKKRRGKFMGHGVPESALRKEPLPVPSGRVVVRSPALKEEADVNIYNEDGTFNQEALAKLDRLMRCRRTGEERAADPRLYVILSMLHDQFGKQIELNSGFRYQRNEGSRHFHASAMDVQIPGVHWREIYKFAESLDTGGMGIGQYPRSGFVHIDFRAPGEPSYRWTDTKGSDGGRDPGKAPSRMWSRSSRPNT